jgi:hypothetical protein
MAMLVISNGNYNVESAAFYCCFTGPFSDS